MSMKDSITSVNKYPLRQSQFIQRLNSPLSESMIKNFSNPVSMSTVGTKTHSIKIKKYGSIQTNSTDSDALLNDQEKFINRYRSDLIYRKKVDILIKQHQKRMKQKQQNYALSKPQKLHPNNTWRTQRQSEDTTLIDLYQKCRKWITKAHQSR